MESQNVASVTANKSHGKNHYFNVDVEGVDEILKAFNELGEDAILKLSEPSIKAAEVVLNKAKAKINDDMGDLKNALYVAKPGRGKSTNKRAYQIFAKVSFGKGGMHGVPLELGHKLVSYGKKTDTHIKEKPFLIPAADESKEEVASIMEDAMKRIIDEAELSKWADNNK
jgi:hypothetical protein